MEKRRAAMILLLLSTLQVALCIGSMRGDSATADEGAHIAAGWLKVVDGRLDFFREQPPLMNALSALPLVVRGYEFPRPSGETSHWSAGAQYLFGSGYDSQRILVQARLPTIALFALLPWIGYAFVARETASRPWGIAAFSLIAFCPTLIAHGRLATVDMGATVLCFLAATLLIRLSQSPSMATGAGFGIAAAAAILSKTSALILLPYAAAVVMLALIVRHAERRRLLLALLAAAVAAAITVEVIVLSLADEGYIARQYPGLTSPFARLTLPFQEIAANVAVIREWYSGGSLKVQYLLGRFSESGWWYYYPVALYLKLTIPALLLSAAGVVLLAARKATFSAVCLLLFVAIFLAAAMSGDLALGVRYVLPILPFLYAGAVIVLSRSAGRKASIAIAALLAWHVGEAVATYPTYIGYFNQTIGSHRNADRYLIDSNLDWGQDLRRLDAWCRRNGVNRIAVHYFGGGDPRHDMTVETIPVTGMGQPDVPAGAYFALSRHFYRISFWRALSPMTWSEYLAQRNARYVTTVGDSILVYRIPLSFRDTTLLRRQHRDVLRSVVRDRHEAPVPTSSFGNDLDG